jgi:anti-anti-sigma factor
MHTSVDRRGDVITVHVAGSVDGLTAEGLQQVFAGELAARHHNLVADLGAVEYTSSAGLRVLLATLKQARSGGGDLRLAAPNPDVRKVLDLSGFTNILKVFPTVDDAVASFGA